MIIMGMASIRCEQVQSHVSYRPCVSDVVKLQSSQPLGQHGKNMHEDWFP